MAGFGGIGWGIAPWGLGGGVSAVSSGLVVDEGGEILTVTGVFIGGTRATVLVGTADAPCPRALGGTNSAGGLPGSGNRPLVSPEGTSLVCVTPQMPPGVYDVTVQQPGQPDKVLVDGLEVVRRDHWTRLHTLRSWFPTPPYPFAALGPKGVKYERLADEVATEGEHVPALRGVLHALSGALLEADSVLYTRTVPAPWLFGSVASLVSTAAADTTQTATLVGIDVVGAAQEEALALNGVVPVLGAAQWSDLRSVTLDAACVGTLTVSDTDGSPPERIVVNPGYRTKGAGQLQPGDMTVVVDGLYRFPEAGTIALRGERVAYASRVRSHAVNYFTLATGVLYQHDERSVVADATGVTTGVDLACRSMQPDFAEGPFLDAVARRYGGVPRPAGLGDDAFRGYYKAVAFARVGTERVLEHVLDAIVGAGNYEIIEDPHNYPGVVFIAFGALVASGAPFGATYFCGGEAQTSTGLATVDTAYDVAVPYGVYTAADIAAGLGRSNNYCNAQGPADAQVGAPGITLTSGGALFVAGDDAKQIRTWGAVDARNNGVWVAAFVAAATLTLSGVSRAGGYVDAGDLDIFAIGTDVPLDACPFGPSWRGRTIRVLDTLAGAPLDRTVTEVIDRRHVRVGVAYPGAGSAIAWCDQPALQAEVGFNWELARVSAIGNTITLARNLPGAATVVLVDYTHMRSGVVLLDTSALNVNIGALFPFYLSDPGGWLRSLLDDLTAAGVIPVVGDPHT